MQEKSQQSTKQKSSFLTSKNLIIFTLLTLILNCLPVFATQPTTNLQNFSFKIFRVESGLYPFVQLYLRTFDQDMNPLVNLNERNIGVMIKGRSYNFTNLQYRIHTITNRDEAVRTIIILDTSVSMAGEPFRNARIAISRFIDGKRPQDQVAVIALADNDKGYEITSNFERDNVVLGNRLADLKANSKKTRLYDAIGAAIQLSGSAYVGGITSIDATYIASSSIIVFSDGHDTGSAVTRDDLMTRISNLPVPVPVYTLAYTQSSEKYLGNLQAISKNAFGKYYGVNETLAKMTRCVEDVQNILRNDYVVTLRAYLPIDGEFHSAKLGIEYPSNSGNILYESFKLEAMEPPPAVKVKKALETLNNLIPELPDKNPYFGGANEAPKGNIPQPR